MQLFRQWTEKIFRIMNFFIRYRPKGQNTFFIGLEFIAAACRDEPIEKESTRITWLP